MKDSRFKRHAVVDPKRLKFKDDNQHIIKNEVWHVLPSVNDISILIDDDSIINSNVAVYDVVATNNRAVKNSRSVKSPKYSNQPPATVPIAVNIIFNYKPLTKIVYPKSTLPVEKTNDIINSTIEHLVDVARNGTRHHLIQLDIVNINRTRHEYDELLRLSPRNLSKRLTGHVDYILLTLHMYILDIATEWDKIPTSIEVYFSIKSGSKLLLLSLWQLLDIRNGGGGTVNGVHVPKVTNSQKKDFIPNLIHGINKYNESISTNVKDEEIGSKDILKDHDAIVDATKHIDKVKEPTFTDSLPEDDYEDYLDSISDDISAKQYRRARKFINDPTPNIYSNDSISDFTNITNDDKKVTKTKYRTNDSNMDKSLHESSIENLDKDYLNNVLNKHIVSVFDSFKRGGVSVVSHKVENKSNITGSYDVHTIKVKSVRGGTTTIPIRAPTIDDSGVYKFNNSIYRMRRQKVDVPILKISNSEVTLTSYYGSKQFITRSELAVDNPYRWIVKQLLKRALDTSTKSTVEEGDNYSKTDKVPYMYSGLSRLITSYKDTNLMLRFNNSNANELGPIKKDKICIGTHRSYGYLYMDFNNVVTGDKFTGSIYDILSLDENKAPHESAYVTISGSRIYIGMLLSYLIGIIPLLKLLKCDISITKPRKRETGDAVLVFKDVKLIVNNISDTAKLIINGLLKYRLRDFTLKDYNNKDTFRSILMHESGITSRVTNEYELINEMFVDPITKDVLKDMKEPTSYIPLSIRACELLTISNHPRSTEMQRIRGYERIPGAMYSEMIKSIRAQRNRPNSRIEMSPYAVWGKITGDSSNKIVEASNPIAALRDMEAVIASGDGGRSSDTLTIDARKYDENDIGTISESIPDNGDVGLAMYLTANPNIENTNGVMGNIDKLDTKNLGQYYSTSVASVPCVHKDDFSRMAFVAIQGQHVIATDGMETTYVRTGYEDILPQRMTKNYAIMAKSNGVVLSKEDTGMIIEYTNGDKVGIKLGTEYTVAEGAKYDHELITNLNKGDKFKTGWALSWHSGFFEQDTWIKGGLLYRYAKMAMLYLSESTLNYEDSVVMGSEIADDMHATMIVEKSYTGNFTDDIIDLVKIGTEVNVGTKLFTLVNEQVTSNYVDSDVGAALTDLDSDVIYSKYKGIIDDIVVLYHGQTADMSPSMLRATRSSNYRLKKIADSSGEEYHTGAVDTEYRVAGNSLLPDTLEIKIFTKVDLTAGNGDKFVVGAQLKCTISDVVSGMKTQSGVPIDLGFSGLAYSARVVSSFSKVSAASKILYHLNRMIKSIYEA